MCNSQGELSEAIFRLCELVSLQQSLVVVHSTDYVATLAMTGNLLKNIRKEAVVTGNSNL